MRARTTTAAALAAALLLAGAAAPAAADHGTTDIADTVDVSVRLFHESIAGDVRVFEAHDVVVGEGPELTAADEVGTSEVCGDLRVDIDPVRGTLRVTPDTQPCYVTRVEVAITGWEFAGLYLLRDVLGSTELDGPEGATLLDATDDGTTLTLTWTPDAEDSFYLEGEAVVGYLVGDPFVDVWVEDELAWYVWWLDRSDIGTGYGDGTFRPTAPVSRQAMAAFLYRKAVGLDGVEPGPAPEVPPFADVAEGQAFATEITWMFTSGLSTGTQDGDQRYYLPASAVSRQAMAAFLFRQYADASYEAPAVSPFLDVATDHPFYEAIAWMAESGLSTGTRTPDGALYRPTDAVSRRAMAAFLYRTTQLPND